MKEVISDTYWSIRRPNHQNLLSLLMANSVTGAASLFRRDVLAYALPFPPRQFSHFHDHWIGLVARVLGEVALSSVRSTTTCNTATPSSDTRRQLDASVA